MAKVVRLAVSSSNVRASIQRRSVVLGLRQTTRTHILGVIDVNHPSPMLPLISHWRNVSTGHLLVVVISNLLLYEFLSFFIVYLLID